MSTANLMTYAVKGEGARSSEIAELGPWFHNLHLPDGTQTAPDHPLGDFPMFKWKQIALHLPQDLTGWTALDIGCNAGFYSIELARRGAQVVALDKDEHFLRQARWAAAQFSFGDRIDVRQGQVYELARWNERFDLVLFMGVFYHLRYPVLALDLVSERVKRLLVFQTFTMPGDEVAEIPNETDFNDRSAMLEPGWPKMAFIEKNLAGDPTNWWAPNRAAIEGMLRTTGLEVIARPEHEIYLCEPIRGDRWWQRDEAETSAATGRSLRPGEKPLVAGGD